MKLFNSILILVCTLVIAMRKRSKSLWYSGLQCDDRILADKEHSFETGLYVVSILPMSLTMQVSFSASSNSMYTIKNYLLKNGDLVNIVEIKHLEERVRGRLDKVPESVLMQGISTAWITLYHSKFPNSEFVKAHNKIQIPWKSYTPGTYYANIDLHISTSRRTENEFEAKDCIVFRGASLEINKIDVNLEKTKLRGKLKQLPETLKLLGHKEAWVTLYSATLPKDTFVSRSSTKIPARSAKTREESDMLEKFTNVFKDEDLLNRAEMKTGKFSFLNPLQKYMKRAVVPNRKNAYKAMQDENDESDMMSFTHTNPSSQKYGVTPTNPSGQKHAYGIRNRFVFASSSILSTQQPSNRPASVLGQRRQSDMNMYAESHSFSPNYKN